MLAEDAEHNAKKGHPMKYLLFTSPTCKACPAMKRNLAAAGLEYDEHSIDVEANRRLASTYFVTALPTLVLVKDGKAHMTLQGARPVFELEEIRRRYGA